MLVIFALLKTASGGGLAFLPQPMRLCEAPSREYAGLFIHPPAGDIALFLLPSCCEQWCSEHSRRCSSISPGGPPGRGTATWAPGIGALNYTCVKYLLDVKNTNDPKRNVSLPSPQFLHLEKEHFRQAFSTYLVCGYVSLGKEVVVQPGAFWRSYSARKILISSPWFG